MRVSRLLKSRMNLIRSGSKMESRRKKNKHEGAWAGVIHVDEAPD